MFTQSDYRADYWDMFTKQGVLLRCEMFSKFSPPPNLLHEITAELTFEIFVPVYI